MTPPPDRTREPDFTNYWKNAITRFPELIRIYGETVPKDEFGNINKQAIHEAQRRLHPERFDAKGAFTGRPTAPTAPVAPVAPVAPPVPPAPPAEAPPGVAARIWGPVTAPVRGALGALEGCHQRGAIPGVSGFLKYISPEAFKKPEEEGGGISPSAFLQYLTRSTP